MARPLLLLALVLLPALAPGPAGAETWFWVDAGGVTHITDDPDAVPESARRVGRGRVALREAWDGDPSRPAAEAGEASAAPGPLPATGADRAARLLRGAVADLERGENARASVALESILRDAPGRPEPHWYLAELDRQRGRYESAELHLRAFLASAGDGLESWRGEARRSLAYFADERRLADEAALDGDLRWVRLSTEHFRVSYDERLGEASPDYARTVLRFLEEARVAVGERLGALPREAMGVRFYGKAAYLRAHRHRFSFQTVGFFDGRIHVVSAAHPEAELRELLFHEYAHAVYREQTGMDQPYWLNEGLAELSERSARGQGGLTRSERVGLRTRIDAGEWIPLRVIAPSFAGLDDADARAAYLEATAAAVWIQLHSDRVARGELLARLGRGEDTDTALRATLGLDSDGLDAAVQRDLLAEFKQLAGAGS